MDRRRAAGALLALAVCVASSAAAPTSNDTALDIYDGSSNGCYYNFQSYGEGDRIMTNEPCLNCTCHNRMLMCYLRVCPFTKPIGQDCTVEKRADQCCPIVTCPDVPVDLLTSTSTSSPAEYGGTGLGKVDKYGCDINGKYFSEGAKVPPSPNKPCEHCYCIRNMTTCVMQECTLHVEGCTPIYNKDVCCPVRYSCDHPEDEIPMLDDMTTTVRPTPGFLLTTTTLAPVTQTSQECVHNDEVFSDGALIKTEKACEHCYCMKGDIVCVVQECGTPMENEGKNCTSVTPRDGQCCPDTYICEGDDLNTELISELTTVPYQQETTSPPRRVAVEGSGYRNEDELPYTEIPIFGTEPEGSGEEPIMETVTKSEISEKEPELIDEGFMMTDTPHKISPTPTEVTTNEEEKATTEPDKGLNTVPDVLPEEEPTESSSTKKPSKPEHEVYENPETTTANVILSLDDEKVKEKPIKSSSTQTPEQTYETTTGILLESATKLSDEPKITTASTDEATEVTYITTIDSEKATDVPKLTTTEEAFTESPKLTTESLDVPKKTSTPASDQLTEIPKLSTVSSEQMTDIPKVTEVSSEHPTEVPDYITVSSEQVTEMPKVTTQTDAVTTTAEITTTSKTEKEISSPTILETTTINVVDNEIDEDSTAYPSPGRIPGEGDCLLDGVTYHNESTVISNNKCHSSCRCISSIIKCEPIICSPPPEYMDNCQSVYDSPDACCPTYVCDHSKETVPPQSHNQMSGTESPLAPPKECSGSECKPTVNEPCTSESCDETQIANKPNISECTSDGCEPNKIPSIPEVVPCDGENCVVRVPELPETPSGCEGEACKGPSTLNQDKEKCDESNGCKQPEKNVITEECNGNDCRRVGLPIEIEKEPALPNEITTEKQASEPDVTATEKPLILETTTIKHIDNSKEQTTKPETETPVITEINDESTQEPQSESEGPASVPLDSITKASEASTTPTDIKDTVSSDEPKPETTKTPSELSTEAADNDGTTPKSIEKLSTGATQEAMTEPSNVSGAIPEQTQENEIQPEIQSPTTSHSDVDQSTQTPSKCVGNECEIAPEPESCDPIQGCKEQKPVDTKQDKFQTELPTKCEGSECEALATSPASIIPDKKCDSNEGCKLPESTVVAREPSTEQPVKCDGSECKAELPVETIVPQGDKCESNDCKSTDESNEPKPSCSGSNCDSPTTNTSDIPSSEEGEIKPELESTTTAKDITVSDLETKIPFTNPPIGEDLTTVGVRVTQNPENEITSAVTDSFETKTPSPEIQDTTNNTPAERGDTESESTKYTTQMIATTIAPHVSEPENPSSNKPDYHDTEPEISTAEPTKSVTDQSLESSTMQPIVVLDEHSTEKQQDVTDQLLTTEKPAEPMKPDAKDEETENKVPPTETPIAIPVDIQTNKPEFETPEMESATEQPLQLSTEKETTTSESKSPSTEIVPEIQMTSETPNSQPPVQSAEGTSPTEELETETGLPENEISATKEPQMTVTASPTISVESVGSESSTKITEKPESVTKLPEQLPSSTSESDNAQDDVTTQGPKQETTEQALATDKYSEEPDQDQKSPKPIATESQVLMTEPTKTYDNEIQPTEKPEKPEFADKETSVTTVASETIEKEQSTTTAASEPSEKDQTAITVTPVPTEKEESATTISSVSDEKEPSATTVGLEPAEREPSATTVISELSEKESSATTLASEATEKEPIATTEASESAEKDQGTTTLASEAAEKEPSATTVTPKPVEKESSATTLSSESDEKEPSANTVATKPVERDQSATTLASEVTEKEPSATTVAPEPVEKESSATTVSSETDKKEPSASTVAAKPVEKDQSATTLISEVTEKEPSATTVAPEPVENESSATTLSSESDEKEQSATTGAAKPIEKDQSATTLASEPAEKEPSATTVAQEPVDNESSTTTLSSESDENVPSATTGAEKPIERDQGTTTVASEPAEKEPSATTITPEPVEKESSATTQVSESAEEDSSATTAASKPAEEDHSATTVSSELANEKFSTTTVAPEPQDKEPESTSETADQEAGVTTVVPPASGDKEPNLATTASESAQKESTDSTQTKDKESELTTIAPEIDQRVPSETTTASGPENVEAAVTTVSLTPDEPARTNESTAPVDTEPIATTMKPKLTDKETSATLPVSEFTDKEPSQTTLMTEYESKDPIATTPISELGEKEASVTTPVADSEDKETSVTTPVSEIIEKEPESVQKVTKTPEAETPAATTPKNNFESSETTVQPETISQEQPEASTTIHEGVSSETTEPSETTPDQVELELHTHKAEPEEYSTTLPELSSSETPETTGVQEESIPTIEDGHKTGVPEQTTMKIDMILETATEKGPAIEQKPEIPAIETTTTSPEILKDDDNSFGDVQTSTVTPISVTTAKQEKNITTSESPVQQDSGTSTQRPSVIAEEEFIPVTSTKAPKETEKPEEEPIQTTPVIDKFTKTEEKPEAFTETPELPKPVEIPTDETSPPEEFPPSGGYGQEPDYVEEDQSFGPGTCRYGGKVYVSAQQIPRDDPCDFCFCFRSDIICLQQSCPPPIHGCHEEPISGFCCPRYECPVSMATTLNVTTTTTTTTTTLPPHFFPHAYKGAAQRKGCVIKGQTYKVGDVVRASSGPCLHCTCGGDGQMKCDPKACTPEPMLRQMIAAAVSARRRR